MSLDSVLRDSLDAASRDIRPDVESALVEARRLGHRRTTVRRVTVSAVLGVVVLTAVVVGAAVAERIAAEPPLPAGPVIVDDASVEAAEQLATALTGEWRSDEVSPSDVRKSLSDAGLAPTMTSLRRHLVLPNAWQLKLQRDDADGPRTGHWYLTSDSGAGILSRASEYGRWQIVDGRVLFTSTFASADARNCSSQPCATTARAEISVISSGSRALRFRVGTDTHPDFYGVPARAWAVARFGSATFTESPS